MPARTPATAPVALPPALAKMAADGLSLGPAALITGRDGKPRIKLDGATQVGQVPIAGQVQLGADQSPAGLPRVAATGAGTINSVPVAGSAKLALAKRKDTMVGAVVVGNGSVAGALGAGAAATGTAALILGGLTWAVVGFFTVLGGGSR